MRLAVRGISLLAHPHNRLLSPATMYSIIFGTIRGLKIEILIHFFIGLLGMWFLARYLGLRGIYSLFPGILYMLNSIYPLHISAGHHEWLSMAYLPMAFLCYLKGY